MRGRRRILQRSSTRITAHAHSKTTTPTRPVSVASRRSLGYLRLSSLFCSRPLLSPPPTDPPTAPRSSAVSLATTSTATTTTTTSKGASVVAAAAPAATHRHLLLALLLLVCTDAAVATASLPRIDFQLVRAERGK